jgi:hypothetical protein
MSITRDKSPYTPSSPFETKCDPPAHRYPSTCLIQRNPATHTLMSPNLTCTCVSSFRFRSVSSWTFRSLSSASSLARCAANCLSLTSSCRRLCSCNSSFLAFCVARSSISFAKAAVSATARRVVSSTAATAMSVRL